MNRPDHDDLLKEVFADEALDALRANSLGAGLAALRARRRNRALRLGALASVPVLALAAVWLNRAVQETAIPQPTIAVVTAAPNPTLKIYPAIAANDAPPVPTISDEELLALFPNRAVGLLGAPGHQQLVFFDKQIAAR
jgi:hypothetical protein